MTLLVVSLLLLIVVAFSIFVRMELKQVIQHQQLLEARANAKLSAMLALSALQESAGPDTRISYPLDAESSLSTAQRQRLRMWTAVRDSAELQLNSSGDWEPNGNKGSLLPWLVSGDASSWISSGFPAEDAVNLVGEGSVNSPLDYVAVPWEDLSDTLPERGRLAWWVGDEGVKVRVNQADPFLLDGDASTDDRRHLSLQRAGVERLLTPGSLDPSSQADQTLMERTQNIEHLEFLDSNMEPVSRDFFHAVTLSSESLLTNVRWGGLMKDLTAVLEEALEQDSNRSARAYLLPPAEELPGSASPNQIGKLFAHSDINLDRLFALGRIRDYVASESENLAPGANSRVEVPDKPDFMDRVFPPMGAVASGIGPASERTLFNRTPAEVVTTRGNATTGGHLAQDSGGPSWRQLLSWATARQRFQGSGGLEDEVEYFYSTETQTGVHPVILRYTKMRFYTYDPASHEFHIHVTPVVSLWNPTDIDLPSQPYYLHLFNSSEQQTIGSGGVEETLHFQMSDLLTGAETWRSWNVHLAGGKLERADVSNDVPAVFVARWQGALEAGERVTLAMRSGERLEIPEFSSPEGSYLSSGARVTWKPSWSSESWGNTPWPTLDMVEWDELDFGVEPLGSAYVSIDLNGMETRERGDIGTNYIFNYQLGTVNQLDEIRITFSSFALSKSMALQLSPRWRKDRDNRNDLSSGEGDGAALVNRNQFAAPLSTVFQPPFRVPQSLRNLTRTTTPFQVRVSQLPNLNDSVYALGAGANTVMFGQTIGLRMPDRGDPYFDNPDPQQLNLYAPYPQLAFGNPLANNIGRAPPERGPDRNASRLGYNSPPQYIGGWAADLGPFLEQSSPRFGFSALPGDANERAVLREFPHSIHDLTSVAGLQHALSFAQVSYQFSPYGRKTGINQMARVGGLHSHGWGGNTVPMNAVGNSLASPYVPADEFQFTNWEDPGMNEANYNFHTMYDYSYVMNEALWDDFFFSSNANSRLRWDNPDWNEDESLVERDVDESASRLHLVGGFNVHSTSVQAWAALLHGMMGASVEVDGSIEQTDTRAPFSRFSRPTESMLDVTGTDGEDPALYRQTFRALTAEEIWDNAGTPDDLSDDSGLAVELVREIRARGPFPSMASFVNRSLLSAAADPDGHRLKGAIQAAIDRSGINDQVVDGITATQGEFRSGFRSNGNARQDWEGIQMDHVDNMPMNWGAPGFLTQADLLSRIGAALRPRSDTFVIRAAGTVGQGDAPTAQAFCELVVQRSPEYLEADVDPATDIPEELDSLVNQTFGRRFQIVSFRWLAKEEL